MFCFGIFFIWTLTALEMKFVVDRLKKGSFEYHKNTFVLSLFNIDKSMMVTDRLSEFLSTPIFPNINNL